MSNFRSTRRPYGSGDRELDAKIAALVLGSGIEADTDLLAELICSSFRLVRQRSDRGELRMVNAALKEFWYSFKVFKPYRGIRKVAIFGSSRSTPSDPNYQHAARLASDMAGRGWMIITGAGPGIMEGGNVGAGTKRSFGANIRLPMEVPPNEIMEGDPKLINFKYFFTRKVTLLKESDAVVLFPGGLGTLDEAFESLTLMQTGKSHLRPVVFLEAPESSYWIGWRSFVDQYLVKQQMICPEDCNLFCITDSIEEAAAEIEGFYRNYQSQRIVDGMMVLRLLRLPPPEALEGLNREFSDLSDESGLKVVEPSNREVEEGDSLECARIGLEFDHRGYGRLRKLIDALNSY